MPKQNRCRQQERKTIKDGYFAFLWSQSCKETLVLFIGSWIFQILSLVRQKNWLPVISSILVLQCYTHILHCAWVECNVNSLSGAQCQHWYLDRQHNAPSTIALSQCATSLLAHYSHPPHFYKNPAKSIPPSDDFTIFFIFNFIKSARVLVPTHEWDHLTRPECSERNGTLNCVLDVDKVVAKVMNDINITFYVQFRHFSQFVETSSSPITKNYKRWYCISGEFFFWTLLTVPLPILGGNKKNQKFSGYLSQKLSLNRVELASRIKSI